jgi:hypothetical protein
LLKKVKGGIKMFGDMSTIEIIKLFAPLIVIDLCLKVFCVYRLTKDKVRFLPKIAWLFIVLIVSTFGPLSFLILGRVKD